MLPDFEPTGDVVTERVAELIVASWKVSNRTVADMLPIAGRFATSVRSVERVVNEWKATGVVRCPIQGQGKTSDPRYVFAGPEGRLNLYNSLGTGFIDR